MILYTIIIKFFPTFTFYINLVCYDNLLNKKTIIYIMARVGTFLSGQEFNKKYKNCVFYKIATQIELHNGPLFYKGVFVNKDDFDFTKKCKQGYTYFVDRNNIHKWSNCLNNIVMLRQVKVKEDALVDILDNKFRADKLYLYPDKPIWDDYKLCTYAVQYQGIYLQYVKKNIITQELCKLAVEHNGYAIKYVPYEFINKELSELAKEHEENNKQEICNYSHFYDLYG